MAKDIDDDTLSRHVYGPRPVSALVPALVRPAFRKRSPATAQVMADWDSIVGPAIGAVTQPRRLFTGTLSIACTGPIALELQHLATELIGRINAFLGQVVVTRLRFVQDLPPVPLPAAPRPARAIAAARAATGSVTDPELRAALEKLGQYVLRPPHANRP